MSQLIPNFHQECESIQRDLKRVRTKHVNTKEIKNKIRTLVQKYFSSHRPCFVSAGCSESTISDIDQLMQSLLKSVQHRTLKAIFLKFVKRAINASHELEIQSVKKYEINKNFPICSPKDQQILEMLCKVCESAAVSYEQGLIDIKESDRKSWRGTAVEFRESLRELLDRLAPDKDVQAQQNFKLEQNAKKPTMKQKVVFILRNRRTSNNQLKVSADAVDIVDGLVGAFVRSVYDSSSGAKHTVVPKEDILKVKSYLDLVFAELLEIRA